MLKQIFSSFFDYSKGKVDDLYTKIYVYAQKIYKNINDVINLLRITATIKIIFDMIIIFLLFLIVMLLYKILGVVVIQ